MSRSVVGRGLNVFKSNGGSFRTSATMVAAENLNVLPFSQIPKLPTIPYLRGGWAYLPIIGKYNLFALHKASVSKTNEYGPIYLEEFSKDLKMVTVSDPKDFEKVYRTEGKYPNRMSIGCVQKYREKRRDIYKNGGLITSQGEEWYEMRSQVQPHMMKPKAIHAYLRAMDDVGKQMVDKIPLLRGKSDNEIPDLLQELYKWSLESVGLVALDTHLGCLDANPKEETIKLIQIVSEIFEYIWKFEFGAWKFWKIFPTPAYIKFSGRMDFFSHTVQKYLEESMQRLKKIGPISDREVTFLEQMISTTKDPRIVIAMITDMFLGGIDTTSTTVGLTLYHLGRNPEVQEKAYREVKSLLQNNQEISLKILNEIRYLKACVKESMRLTPVVIGNIRILQEDTVLSGYHVPAGSTVFLQSYVAGFQAKDFPEPYRFNPDRFLRDEISHDPFAFLPFGFGPRSCVGRRIAEQEIWTLLIRMVERYRMEYHHEEIDLVTRTVVTPDRPLRIQFFDR